MIRAAIADIRSGGACVKRATLVLVTLLVSSLAAAGSLHGAGQVSDASARVTYGGKTLTFKAGGNCYQLRKGGYHVNVDGRFALNYITITTARAKVGSYGISARASVEWHINGRRWIIQRGGIVNVSEGLVKGTFSGRVYSSPRVDGVGSQGRGSWTCSKVHRPGA